MELTQARVRELFDYRADGSLLRKTSTGGQLAGSVVGSKSGYYLITMVDRKFYKVHRIIFLWHHGWLPPEIDHIDLDKSNNRIANLRPAEKTSNAWNVGKRANNTSGFKGVTWSKRWGKWYAQIQVNGKRKGLGYFDTPEKAHAAYIEAARKHHGEFARAA